MQRQSCTYGALVERLFMLAGFDNTFRYGSINLPPWLFFCWSCTLQNISFLANLRELDGEAKSWREDQKKEATEEANCEPNVTNRQPPQTPLRNASFLPLLSSSFFPLQGASVLPFTGYISLSRTYLCRAHSSWIPSFRETPAYISVPSIYLPLK